MDFKSVSAEISALDAKKAAEPQSHKNANDFPDLFPSLPASAPAPAQKGAWGQPRPKIQPSTITEVSGRCVS